MKLPRSLSSNDLIYYLKKLGNEPTRQTGSHIRLTTTINGIHHITIPNRNPLRVGTLASILREVANHFHISREELYDKLF